MLRGFYLDSTKAQKFVLHFRHFGYSFGETEINLVYGGIFLFLSGKDFENQNMRYPHSYG